MPRQNLLVYSSLLMLFALGSFFAFVVCSQEVVNAKVSEIQLGEMKFPEIIGADVPGAPTLQPPILVMAGDAPVLTEKHGLAAPALWDWDGDGKKDLLVGEFETNSSKFPMGELGSSIRVYQNIGTNEEPRFSSNFEWARDTRGTVMEVPQWCCIGFTPYFYDLNDDGFDDMITGQYHPGEVTWFRGSEDGFLLGKTLKQKGDPSSSWNPDLANLSNDPKKARRPAKDKTFAYWVYSSAAMGDFDGDGDYDLIIGGSALKISENIGTKKKPRFGKRELLLDINGKPLSIGESAPDEAIENWPYLNVGNRLAGDSKVSPYVVDWDRDGILDLLVTGSYRNEGSMAVAFFKGVKVDGEHRFHTPVDLLATADGSKALPGSGPRLFVDDWNNDGTPDLIIGASVATVNGGEFSDELSWEWEGVNNVESAGKDPGRYPPREKPYKEQFLSMLESNGGWKSDEELDEFVDLNVNYWQETVGVLYDTGREHWLTMRHQGRIYVLLGSDEEITSTVEKHLSKPNPQVEETSQVPTDQDLPVQLELLVPEKVQQGGKVEISMAIDIQDGWYIYAPTGRNAEQGMRETEVSFEFADSLQTVGEIKMPPHQYKGSYEIYRGPQLTVSQEIATEDCKPGDYEITGEVTYQTCKDDLCLPPKTVILKGVLTVAGN